VDPDKSPTPKSVRLIFNALHSNATVKVSRVDDQHGNTLAAYRAMGTPRYPTEEQIRQLNAATALPSPAEHRVEGNHLDLHLDANALVLVELSGGS